VTTYRSGFSGPVVGVSLGHRDLAEADHWIRALSPAPVVACTHLVRSPFPHVAISLAGSSGVPTAPELRDAAAQAEHGRYGRAVVFPGSDLLTGTMSVAEIVERSAIDRVDILGGGPADPGTLVDTGDFVRPQYAGDDLVLITTPAAGGRLVPFERRDPTPCCAAH
jgi:hypothetical protein